MTKLGPPTTAPSLTSESLTFNNTTNLLDDPGSFAVIDPSDIVYVPASGTLISLFVVSTLDTFVK